ncbi:TSL-kinase interacting protein 1 isoform X1 [Actinidia eriantha]|uniref:TSL-kinase interacting protein 1 isoform X1 n=1 Tax=Actinidia eriantha TaxID=165200 RepID=UPI00258D21BE|nr:TSL-kinase interacting protein 1 isoform X1 [Actinidia eriantha]XP_057463693.1 TSL-kinase interacting protein 1 isoform X1 [Actinidia eriantha]
MQMEQQVSLDCEPCLRPENILIKNGVCCVTAPSPNHDLLQPVFNAAKKQTRQWAAWTRQEEESFFTALRQVGKNFEKITSRVQSKNKDQVRHYYYRLVRRMNKLLGPGLCLDAKNSKDTNAAMLRWWSLLEKYSCKASKLHLKPRRLKIFIEALEDQLLKDRRKSKRKQPSHGENCSPAIPTNVSNQGRASGHDTHAVKLVLVDSQKIKKLGPVKGSSVRRNVNVGINRSNCKGDSFPAKTVRQRRRPAGTVSTAAYKRWEKAAIAGVSLVADAAEHLERTTIDKEAGHVQGTLENGFDPVRTDPPLPTSSPNFVNDNNTQTSTKLKLQLFPIEEGTRRALEMDNHNPHLELTLSTRKKISSVLEHLNRKWGNSSVATGELMLFPYFVQIENLVGYQRWTQDSVVNAADVYSLIGSPPVFRLRYGWFSNAELVSAASQARLESSGMILNLNMKVNNTKEHSHLVLETTPPIACHHSNKDQQVFEAENASVLPSSPEASTEVTRFVGVDGNNNIPQSSDGPATVPRDRRETDNGAILRGGGNKDDPQLRNGPALSAGEWADSLTNISLGDLLSEVNCVDPPMPGNSQCLQQCSFSCDSFDAAIAAHIHRHQNKTSFPPPMASLASSIWDAEDTCDGFSFQNTVLREDVRTASTIASSEACKQICRMSSARSGATVEDLPEMEVPMEDNPVDEEPMDENPDDEGSEDDNLVNGDPVDECLSPTILENSAKDFNGLTDMYWPDSLGPLDLDLPTSRYHTEDLILSDSLSGLNRLLASSLDAFQNCSFFGLDKKEMASTVEAQGTASFQDYKIGSGV